MLLRGDFPSKRLLWTKPINLCPKYQEHSLVNNTKIGKEMKTLIHHIH